MKILLVHPGFSLQRHLNNIEISIKLINRINNIRCDAIVCDGTINACGFKGFKKELRPDSEFPLYDPEKCINCQQKLIEKIRPFCRSIISISDLISKENLSQIDSFLNNFPESIDVNELIKFEFNGVNIGKDIWHSIQYFLLMGNPGRISMPVGSVAFEYFKTGLIYSYAANNLFGKQKYQFVFTNEGLYVDWGIFIKTAQKYKIPVFRQAQYYLGVQFLIYRLYKNMAELDEQPVFPVNSEVKSIFCQNKRKQLASSGKKTIVKWMNRNNSDTTFNKTKLKQQWFNADRKTVVIFSHCCWDAAIAYGNSFFNTFEDWLTETFNIAQSVENVDWIFRLHPEENRFGLNSHANTKLHLNRLLKEKPKGNIKIMDSSVKLSSYDIFPFVHAGVTMSGTIGIELACFGIPSITSSRNGYADKGFTVSVHNLVDYRNTLQKIIELKPLTKSQKETALAYAGINFRKDRFLDVSGLFVNKDSSDQFVNQDLLERFISNKNNQKYIKKKLSYLEFEN